MLKLKQCLKDLANWCKKFDDTGWLQLTGTLGNVVKYRRKNGYVFVQTSAGNKALTASAWTTVGTLPVGFRPSQEIMLGSDTAGATNRAVAAYRTIGAKNCIIKFTTGNRPCFLVQEMEVKND